MSTKLRTTDAFCCLAAAKVFTDLITTLPAEEGIPTMYLHHVANRDDNCTSYGSHKYLPTERVNEFMGPGQGGVYGGWGFKDGSMLLVSSWRNGEKMDRYTIIQPANEEPGFESVKSLIDVTHIRTVTSRDEFRSEAYDKEPVAEQV